jgi:hypothetical protein
MQLHLALNFLHFLPDFGCALHFTPCAQLLWNPPQVSDLQAQRPKQQWNNTIFDQKIVFPTKIWTPNLQDRKPARYQLSWKWNCFLVNFLESNIPTKLFVSNRSFEDRKYWSDRIYFEEVVDISISKFSFIKNWKDLKIKNLDITFRFCPYIMFD